MRLRFVSVALAAFAALTATAVQAQDAANGELLYTRPQVTGKLSCSANACHGKTDNPQNRIFYGLQAANIKAATQRVAQMRFLDNQLGDAQFNDLAAYLAGKLGGTPGYLQVVAMPVPSLTPASLNFGAVAQLSTSPAQVVTVKNASNASAPLTLGAITTTSGSDYSVTGGTCKSGDNVPVGGSCTVLVTFVPGASGTRSAQLNVVHNGSAGTSTLPLTGIGIGSSPVIVVTPPALSYSQTVGSTSPDLRVLVGNTGSGALRLSTLALSGPQATEFTLTPGASCSAGTTLAQGESCGVTVRFAPAATGTRQATLTIAHNALGGSSTIGLTGFGNSTPRPGLLMDAARLDLGDQVASTRSTERVLNLVNNGQADLLLTRISVTGTRASEFALGGSCAVGTPVPAQGSCTVAVSVTPAGLGTREALLDIGSNAPAGTATVTLAANGVPEPAPVVSLSQAALGFGTVAIGASSAARTLVLANSGNASLSLTSIAASSRDFAVTHDCPASLAAGASCALTVVFRPSTATVSEVLVIRSNALSSPNSVVLNGQGSSNALPVLDWLEGSSQISFANAQVGAATEPVLRTLFNRGPGGATMSSLAIVGTDASSFVIGGGTCRAGNTLAVGTSCTIGVRFAPTALGARSATLQVSSDGSNPPELSLAGTGEGFAAVQRPMSVEPAALDYRSGGSVITTGSRSSALTLRIVNDSTASSTLRAVTTSAGFVLEQVARPDACPGVPWTLAPGASCSVAVAFAPDTGGTSTGTLSITTSAGQVTEVPLTGDAATTMTNRGSAETGGGALAPLWGALLGLAVAALRAVRPGTARTPRRP